MNEEPKFRRESERFQIQILLVEDEAPTRMLMWHILDSVGYRVVAATDGFDAVRKISEIGSITLLITDLSMPGMTGVQLAQRAREVISDLKVVYATGGQDCYPEPQAGIICLRKPFTREELLNAVEATLYPAREAVNAAHLINL